jgi:hypothetical protein
MTKGGMIELKYTDIRKRGGEFTAFQPKIITDCGSF